MVVTHYLFRCLKVFLLHRECLIESRPSADVLWSMVVNSSSSSSPSSSSPHSGISRNAAGSTNLKWEVLRVIYLLIQLAVILVPLFLVTWNGNESKCVESLFCFLCHASTKSTILILDGFALDRVSAWTFIFAFASSSFLCTSCLVTCWLLVSCGSLLQTFQLKSNCAGANPVLQWGVVL